jgi:L-rhamnose mutarotase
LETENFEQALAGMAAADVNTRWQREMASFFENTAGKTADQSMRTLEEVFHLD